jgi:putative ABC transport system permease protein
MTAPATPRPPRLAERLVALAARRSRWPETTMGDLREEHAALCGRRGPGVAGAWYWLQALGLVAHAARAIAHRAWRACASFAAMGDHPMLTLLGEARFAVRTLRRQKLVAAAVIITMGLGLGANAAAFSMLNVLVLRPFPFAGVDRLTVLSEQSPSNTFPRESVSPANFLDWRRQAVCFDRLAAMAWADVNFSGGNEPERVHGFSVSPAFFDALELRPAVGRLLVDGDDVAGHDRVVVLSDALWHRRFGGRRDVVGEAVRLDGDVYSVVGIAPPGFDFPMGAELWSPLAFTPAMAANRTGRDLTVIGRLRPGASLTDAESEMAVVGARLRQQYPVEDGDYSPRVQTLALGMTDPGMPAILALIQAGALMVLLIGSANIANLLLARGCDRQREIAVRLAIGGSRSRVIRQLIVESLVLGAMAVPVSIGLAWFALRAIKSTMPAQILRFVAGWDRLGVDAPVLAVVLVGAFGASLLFALLPALQTSKPDLTQALREGGRTVAGARSRQRMRRTFVIAELALVLPLLVAAGLAASAAQRFANGPQGYDPRGVLAMQTRLPDGPYASAETRRQFTERLIDEVVRVPGVTAAATINLIPTSDSNASRAVDIDGHPPADVHHRPEVTYRIVSPRYFETLAIPVIRGRAVTRDDGPQAPPVALVSQSMADRFWPHENPLGRRLRVVDGDHPDAPWMTVVGLTGDVIDDWFDRRNTPMLYLPMAQQPSFTVTLVARTEGEPAALAPAVRHALQTVDANQPPTIVTTLSQSLHDRTIGLQMIGAMMAALGGLALVLAAIGIYSLMAYDVSQRRHEIGLRMALGATRGDVWRFTVGQAGRLSAMGLGVGLVLALLSGRLVESALFGIVALDPLLLASLTLGLLTTALVATLVPARLATRVDPATALRGE